MDNAKFYALEKRVLAGEKLPVVDAFRYERESAVRATWDDNPLLKQQHSIVNRLGQSADRKEGK